MATHCVSVGISVLTNAARKSIFPGSPYDQEAVGTAINDPKFPQAVVAWVRSSPWEASAELNAMRDYLEQGTVDEVYLIGTSSAGCDFVIGVLGRVLREHFGVKAFEVGPKVAPPSREEEFADSLLALWQTLLKYVRKRLKDEKEVMINATGGLKPELAVCLAAGNLTGVPVYYRHELFDRTVLLPPLAWPLCPKEIRDALAKLPPEPIAGPEAGDFYDSNDGSRLERLRLIEVTRDENEEIYRVRLAPYGRVLLDLAGSGGISST